MRNTEFRNEFPEVPWERFPGIVVSDAWIDAGKNLGLLSNEPNKRRDVLLKEVKLGNIGCSLSHLLCLHASLENTAFDFTVMFPDDCFKEFKFNLVDAVENFVKEMPSDCNWLKLKNHCPRYVGSPIDCKYGAISKLENGDGSGPQGPGTLYNGGSAAVVFNSEGARRMLKDHPPIDSTGIDVVWSQKYGDVGAYSWMSSPISTSQNISSRERLNRDYKERDT